jgi:hypothetical protein
MGPDACAIGASAEPGCPDCLGTGPDAGSSAAGSVGGSAAGAVSAPVVPGRPVTEDVPMRTSQLGGTSEVGSGPTDEAVGAVVRSACRSSAVRRSDEGESPRRSIDTNATAPSATTARRPIRLATIRDTDQFEYSRTVHLPGARHVAYPFRITVTSLVRVVTDPAQRNRHPERPLSSVTSHE